MNSSTDEPIEEMRALIRDLATRIESQENELAALRGRLGQGTGQAPAAGATQSRQKVSRAGLLKMAGIGAAAATVAGLDISAQSTSALASDTNPVAAGRVTKAEHGTTVTYDGSPGLTGAVLLGNDSTYGNGGFNYPAAVAGIAGGGANAGTGGLVNGMYGYTERGSGNGIVGFNDNAGGIGNGVLGVAFGGSSSGVHGTNTAGTAVRGESNAGIGVWATSAEYFGVLGQAHNPANFTAGVKGTHDSAGAGIGVYGEQTGAGWGGYFTSTSGRGVNAMGGTGVGVYAVGGSAAVQAFGVDFGVEAVAVPDGTAVSASGGAMGLLAQAGRSVSGQKVRPAFSPKAPP